ncbi:hypothetical protein HPP92_008734 [Vanilla planifolia]|uniref:Uncharacterized protein n=1 Tax=Vanilla planifolia TaxID=51239 RepID=A0A835R364_VANPL|nr:hypothetical protein HPP92_008734 [Vanilla planifolia]
MAEGQMRWRPALESIMEVPEVQSVDRGGPPYHRRPYKKGIGFNFFNKELDVSRPTGTLKDIITDVPRSHMTTTDLDECFINTFFFDGNVFEEHGVFR